MVVYILEIEPVLYLFILKLSYLKDFVLPHNISAVTLLLTPSFCLTDLSQT